MKDIVEQHLGLPNFLCHPFQSMFPGLRRPIKNTEK